MTNHYSPNPLLTSRFEEALLYANQLHAHQLRKGSNIPYMSHLLSVAALILEAGGDEDQAIAGLLHDAIEDQGGDAIRQEIKQRFGENVANIVNSCTDSDIIPKPPWKQRKQQYLEHLRYFSSDVWRVSLADKLHNARSILSDYGRFGESIWSRFHGGREGTLWYYKSIIAIAKENGESSFLLTELEQVIQR